jgi:diacylglycerol O-acyltransferase
MAHYLADVVAPLDALLLKGDADPSTRAIMSSALVLSSPPETVRLTDAFERASRAVPRMRQRVVGPTWPVRRAKWIEDDEFDIADHVRVVGAPADHTVRSVISMASDSATAPLDPARPLWDATLVTGLADGRAVLLLRVHHAIADGVRVLHMMANLLDLEPDPPKEARVALAQRGSRLGAMRDHLMRATSEAVRIQQGRADSAARVMIDTTWRPVETVSAAMSYLRSAHRTYAPGGAEPSPLLRSRSRARHFVTLEFSLAEARTAAKAHSGTVNDVFLTGLLGGLRRYHQAMGEPVADLPVSFPIDVAGDATPESGNHFSAAVIPGPCSVEDPGAMLRAVHELVASRRAEPGVDLPLRLAPALHQIPSKLAATALHAYSRRVDLQASNIAGPDIAVYLAGTKVERVYAFGPLPGVPVMAVLVSYDGTCTVGFTIDPAAVTDHPLFIACVRESFLELIEGAVDMCAEVDPGPPPASV